jgi:hypothetical protein
MIMLRYAHCNNINADGRKTLSMHFVRIRTGMFYTGIKDARTDRTRKWLIAKDWKKESKVLTVVTSCQVDSDNYRNTQRDS